jgi:malonate transporter and related proteins
VLSAFFNGVLPVFGVLAVGFVAGRLKLFDAAAAAAINRYVLLIAVPLLVFRLLARAPYQEFEWKLLLAFLLSELMAYSAGFLIARKVFARDVPEAVLLGLASCFANHLLFVLAIATILFGERASVPIVAIASVDAVTIYGGTLMIMEAVARKNTSSRLDLLMRFAKNPAIAAIPVGLAFGLLDLGLPKGVDAFAAFVSQTASPCALFALGIVLSRQPASGRGEIGLPISISAIKLLLHPVAAWFAITGLAISAEWARPAMMVAASPSAAMAFVFALQYGVRVETIARTVFLTSVGSLLTVTLAASII